MLKGKGVSEGIGLGRVILLKNEDIKPQKILIEDVLAEKEIFYQAIHAVELETEELINRLTGTEKDIMQAYLMILQDPTLIQETVKIMEEEKCNAAYATEMGFNAIIQMFEEMDDPYMAARSADIADMKKKVLSKILRKEDINLSQLPKNTILVTKELTTSDTAKLDLKNMAGIVTEMGGINSHMAIIARTHEIPAIVGIKQVTQLIKENDFIAMNGITGEIFVNPSEENCKKLEGIKENSKQEKEQLEIYKNQQSVTKDGHHVELLANIGGPQDTEIVIKNTAEGVRIIKK